MNIDKNKYFLHANSLFLQNKACSNKTDVVFKSEVKVRHANYYLPIY